MNLKQQLEIVHRMTTNLNGNAPQVREDCIDILTRPDAHIEKNILPRYVEVAEVNETEHRRKVGLTILMRLNVADGKVQGES